MTDYLKLVPVNVTPRGAVVGVGCAVEVGGLTVEVPRPFVMIDGRLAVGPVIEAADGSVKLRLDLWNPMWLTAQGSRVLPLSVRGQGRAVAAARAFDADPEIDWTSPDEDVLAWCHRWVARGTGGDRS